MHILGSFKDTCNFFWLVKRLKEDFFARMHWDSFASCTGELSLSVYFGLLVQNPFDELCMIAICDSVKDSHCDHQPGLEGKTWGLCLTREVNVFLKIGFFTSQVTQLRGGR